MIALALSTSLVSCRNYNAEDGMYGYYNDNYRDRDRDMTDRVPENTKNRIVDSYNKAKGKVKRAFDSGAEYIDNAMGVR